MFRGVMLVLVGAVAVMSAGLYAQQGPIVSTFSLIRLEVTATDGRGRHQPGLTQADFEVLEDGQPQEIEAFEEAKTPLSAILLMDTSESIGKNLTFVQEGAVEFIRQMRPEDEARIMEFNTFVTTSQAPTADKGALEGAIRTMTLSGSTALLNAVQQALVIAKDQRQKDTSRRPAVVLLSDGDDTASAMTSDLVKKTAREAEVPVFAVRIVQPPPSLSAFYERELINRERDSPGVELLSSIADATGGRFILARPNELKRFYADVAEELHAQYRLGYVSTNRKLDGRWRTVTVRVKKRDSLRLKYRAGYYARSR